MNSNGGNSEITYKTFQEKEIEDYDKEITEKLKKINPELFG